MIYLKECYETRYKILRKYNNVLVILGGDFNINFSDYKNISLSEFELNELLYLNSKIQYKNQKRRSMRFRYIPIKHFHFLF